MTATGSKTDLIRLKVVNNLGVILPERVQEEANMIKIEYFRYSDQRKGLYWLLSIMTLGLVPLLCLWKVSIKVFLKYVKADYNDADCLLIHGFGESLELVEIKEKDFYFNGKPKNCKSFMYRLYVYYFDEVSGLFKLCEFSLKDKTYKSIHKDLGKGMPSSEICKQRLLTYGPNSTDIPVKSNLSILFEEILSPFYLFQLYSVMIWIFYIEYNIYAGIIICLSVFTLSIGFYKTRSNYIKLKQKAHFETEVRVYRPSSNEPGVLVPQMIKSTLLVPGDLIEISKDQIMSSDILLLSGTCIMNESMITGETAHVAKIALPKSDKKFDPWSATQHILYAGTECLETVKDYSEPQVVGIVMRTGFWTRKANLIRSYLYVKPESFYRYKDNILFLVVVLVVGILGYISIIKTFVEKEEAASMIISIFFDTFTICVPSILPTVILVGSILNGLRLRQKEIYVKSGLELNQAAKVDVACFDKTGTLTNDYLDLHGVMPVSTAPLETPKFEPIIKENYDREFSPSDQEEITTRHLLLETMITCHNLVFKNEKITGDPLDIKMFKATGWNFDAHNYDKMILCALEPPKGHEGRSKYISVIKRFDMSAKLERNSVIYKEDSQDLQIMCMKGLPRTVKRLCKPETIPNDFEDVVFRYQQCGFEVVACASKILKRTVTVSDNLAREYFEKDLEFSGILIFENRVKEATPTEIAKLLEADIRPIVFSGDGSSEAVFVAKRCGIIKEDQKIILGSILYSHENSSDAIEWSWINEDNTKSPHVEDEKSPMTFCAVENIEIGLIVQQLINQENNGTFQSLKPSRETSQIISSIKADNDIAIIMTGDAIRYLNSISSNDIQLYKSVLKKVQAFSDMGSDDSTFIIEELQKHGYHVAMCGDGTNDCSALKVAHVGIALAENEASLAASFMSTLTDISCLNILLREGRAALVTTIYCFKFIAMYGVVQSMTMFISYANGSFFGDPCFLYQDIYLVLSSIFTVFFTKSTEKLSKQKPNPRLISLPVLASFFGQSVIQISFQLIIVKVVQSQEWYVTPSVLAEATKGADPESEGQEVYPQFESTVLFLIANIQLGACLLAFWVAEPFRQPFYKNWLFLIIIMVTGISSVLLILAPIQSLLDLFMIMDFDAHESFRGIIFAIAMADFLLTIIYEKLVKYLCEKFEKRKKT